MPFIKKCKWSGGMMKKIALAIALCLLLVILIGCDRANTDIPHQGSTEFMSYGGAVFPLSSKGENTGIITDRQIAFDFSHFGRPYIANSNRQLYHNDILVADRYILTIALSKTMRNMIN
jgi:hypothetical protein